MSNNLKSVLKCVKLSWVKGNHSLILKQFDYANENTLSFNDFKKSF